MSVLRCRLVPEDFLYFVSLEFNTFTMVQPLIHNYALTYALGSRFNTAATKNEADYSELEKFDIYATPAVPVTFPRYVGHTYNSVCSRTNLTQSSLNVPSLGRNKKISPLSTEFEFLIFSQAGRAPPPFIRVGKKSCICSVDSTELEVMRCVMDPQKKIETDICFNLLDLSPNDVVYSADMVLTYPSPVAREMTLKSPHLIVAEDGSELVVPVPRHLRGAFV